MDGPPSNESRRADSSDDADGPARRRARNGSDGNRGRGGLAGAVRLLFVAALVAALAIGAATVGPQLLDELDEYDDIGDFGDFDAQPSVGPSSDPPPAGERNPELTDPDDPGESTYETDVERVSSETVEDFVHAEVNDRRAEHGLEPLDWDGTVASVSRAHSGDMADREYFSHGNPEGESPFDRFTDVGDYCQAYGENIAMTWVDRPVNRPSDGDTVEYYTAEGLAEGLVEQWMNSDDHRAAILEEDIDGWDRGGVGVYITEDGQVFATHNFCTEW